jgi:hypothetical protein
MIVPTLVSIVWRFPTRVRPKILADFARWRGQKTLVHIRDDRELRAFLRTLDP